MNQLLKKVIKAMSLPTLINEKRRKNKLIEWGKNGRPVPPPHAVKQQVIIDFSNKFELNTLVETGTYQGDMVRAMKDYFSQIYSIELSEELYKKAKIKFSRTDNVKIIHGDSGIELGKLLNTIKPPTLFWLDGHYSAGVTAKGDKNTPVYEELTHIFNADLKKYVVIIDDARLFGKDADYPSINELRDFVKTHRPNFNIEVKDDSIRITPSKVNG